MAVKIIPASKVSEVDFSRYDIVIYGEVHISKEDRERAAQIVRKMHPDYSLFEALNDKVPGGEEVQERLKHYRMILDRDSREKIYEMPVREIIHRLGIPIDDQYLEYLGEAFLLGKKENLISDSRDPSKAILSNLKGIINLRKLKMNRTRAKAVKDGVKLRKELLYNKVQRIYGSIRPGYFKGIGEKMLEKKVSSLSAEEVGAIFGSLHGYVEEESQRKKIKWIFDRYMLDKLLPDADDQEKAIYKVLIEAEKYGKVGGCDIESARKRISNAEEILDERNRKMYETIKKYSKEGKVFALVGVKHARYLADAFKQDDRDVLVITSEYRATVQEAREYVNKFRMEPVIDQGYYKVLFTDKAEKVYDRAHDFVIIKMARRDPGSKA